MIILDSEIQARLQPENKTTNSDSSSSIRTVWDVLPQPGIGARDVCLKVKGLF